MPPSGRKGKTRVRRAPAADGPDPSDMDTPEALQTPTRSSRKRARATENVNSATRNTRRKIKDTRGHEDTEGTGTQEQSDAETEPALPTEQDIIAHLKVAERMVNATEDFANDLLEGKENVPGYGKIAGRDWTFIIRKIEVNIGRPEAQEKFVIGEDGKPTGPTAKTVVDIDLGPDRQVSRSHALISYEPEEQAWLLLVNGRNGLRLDDSLLKRGSKAYLRNGSVIEIAGTQMAFITISNENKEGPQWHESILRQAQKSSEEDDEGQDDHRTTQRAVANPAARTQISAPTSYPTEMNGQGQHQRSHPHSQRAAGLPGTPTKSQHSVMYTKSSPAANYARGVMMESTESIDYSAESAKDLKPPHSYAQLIGMAILSTPEQQMTLANIYQYIMANYAFYRYNQHAWQNSIRHNLSLNKAFTKIARRTDEPGKGMKWMIEPSEFDNFVAQGMKGCRRPGPVTAAHSAAASPISPMHVKSAKQEIDSTPPLNSFRPSYSYPTATEAYTPERGPKRPTTGEQTSSAGLGIKVDNTEYDFAPHSTPRRNGLTAAANAAGSPPSLYVNDDGRTGPLDTPFPLRPSQRLAPPSTLKRPSDYIQFSSPAPFWKMEGIHSTPFKPYDLSPIKTPFSGLKKDEDEKKEMVEASSPIDKKSEDDGESEAKPKGSPIIESSSPPRPDSAELALDASPSASRPATAVARTLSQLAAASKEVSEMKSQNVTPTTEALPRGPAPPVQALPDEVGHDGDPSSTSMSNGASVNNSFNGSSGGAQNNYNYGNGMTSAGGYPTDDGEDEGIDLAKGFQPIGAFHQRNHMQMMGVGNGTPYGR